MLTKKLIYISKRILAVLALCAYQVNGSDKIISSQCALYDHICNPRHLQPCCDNNLSCKPQQWMNDFVCTDKAQLRSFCNNDEECSEILHAKCSADKQCICRAHNIRINDTYCAPTLGAFCWNDEKCSTDHSTCIEKSCQCKANYQQSNDRCVPLIIGSPCENDTSCEGVKFSKCSDLKICVCLVNTMAVNRTLCLPLLNVPCKTSDDCSVDDSICNESTCQCRFRPLTESHNKCELAHLGMPCASNFTCTRLINHSICSRSGECTCDTNLYVIENNKCVPLLDSVCWDDEPCATNNAICIDNECQCKPNYIYQESSCNPIYLNGTCKKHSDCDAITFAMCSKNNTCVCRNKYISSNSFTCTPSLGALCNDNGTCERNNSICMTGRCQHNTNSSILSSNKPVHVALGSSCQTDANCTIIPKSKCSVGKRCICEETAIAANKFACKSTLYGYCTSNDQCNGDLYDCVNNKCQCKQNYTSVSADQCTATHLLYSCNFDSECSDLWHSHCSFKGTCVCKSNNIAVSRATCLPILNGYCWRDDQCATENSVCADFRCVCKLDFIAVARNRCISIN